MTCEEIIESRTRLLDNALAAMNEACRLTIKHGQSWRGMAFIADWLSNCDAADEDICDDAGSVFPPDAPSVAQENIPI